MPRRSTKTSDIGKRIAANRLQKGLSQATVSRRAGIDPSYLSRIETGKVHPTVRMAMRISSALRVSVQDLLGPSPPDQKDHPCPVTSGGQCLLDLIDTGPDSESPDGRERYTPRQLRLIRKFTGLLQQGNPGLVKALEVLLAELTRKTAAKEA